MKLQLLFTVLSLLHLSAGDPRLVCPETVVTRIGDNVVLPCHLEPEEIIQHEAVEVTKVDPDVLVYAYYNGKQLANDYDAYKHRTFLNTDKLKNGVLNLKISSVRQSDNGMYRIHIDTWRIMSLVTLVVGNPRLVCQETVVAQISNNVTLPCHLEPKQNIENETITCRRADSKVLVYAYSNGKQLPDQEDQYKHRTSLNFEDLKNGVLDLKISSVRQSDSGTFWIYISKWRLNSTVTLAVDLHRETETHNFSSAWTSLEGYRPSDVIICVIICVTVGFAIGVNIGFIIGVTVGFTIGVSIEFTIAVTVALAVLTLGVFVLILVKPEVIERWCKTMMMMIRWRRVLTSQHRAEDPRRAQM